MSVWYWLQIVVRRIEVNKSGVVVVGIIYLSKVGIRSVSFSLSLSVLLLVYTPPFTRAVLCRCRRNVHVSRLVVLVVCIFFISCIHLFNALNWLCCVV